MKKCHWCNSNFDNELSICPHCKTEYNRFGGTTNTNHVANYLEKSRSSNKILCPTCRSSNVKSISTKERIFSVWFFGIFSKKINKSFECKNCGYTW